MYAIVKAGGHQEKVEVGDTILVNRLAAKKGETVEFPVALVVDGSKVTIAAADLAKISVKGEVVEDEAKGPKIRIQKFKNKTGVARRKGHRQKLSIVKITEIA
ncbi:50S ribosomal protein L21 [Bifidobacterium pseudolongum subsp. globosum]|uniref:Large ribosomal subunit protein bL21 n=1 Tax=Bifidobacterium pseudolongum subsp. globosum TaxID=1690 RepID=A0A2N3QYM4_9BIFI|nr:MULTISPECIES: 50S ribosomal protein L21 [Bifidobacterium]MCI6773717.1 50S ribosomal protein L21 [Bifidobacterium pseudolongum]MEE0970845.1 50S ribosomal protein L21 [Bifidobacterium ruminantium]ATO40488.1 50S ribosomal protein L21 [Bifidobacterium pseudolongum subsp. globosum DSM 20092]KFI76886.1 50S ribosomal protein L21 [Bifidobacterium pseudolongum subsp. globosum]MEE1201244.1 50S ribosomal protein L21 [Bifidobacterium sp.]